MDVVLYTEDFEPITVISLTITPQEIDRYMGGRYRVPVREPLWLEDFDRPMPNVPVFAHILTIRVEPLHWKDGSRKWILIAEDDVLALKLDASWLPGQRRQVNQDKAVIATLAAFLSQAMRGD